MKSTNRQDRLVREITAFADWQDMLASLRKGYVPTLRNTRLGHKLAGLVEQAGFRVYQPSSKMGNRR